MSNPYPHGQCTWGAAEMCSCLQNTSLYGNFGNGGDWYAHAQAIGLATSQQPQVGWLCSFDVSGWPSGPGHVALITGINSDGTLTIYGVNWHMDGTWSTDKVSSSLVIGCFKPPCDCSGPNATLYAYSGQGTSQSSCMTFSWSIFGANLCFDGITGLVATAGGLVLLAVGLVVIILATGMGRGIRGSSRQSQQQSNELQTQPQQQPQEQSQRFQRLSPTAQQAITARARQRAQARSTVTRESAMKSLQSGQSLSVEEATALGAVPK